MFKNKASNYFFHKNSLDLVFNILFFWLLLFFINSLKYRKLKENYYLEFYCETIELAYSIKLHVFRCFF